jgi:hypothetical protein
MSRVLSQPQTNRQTLVIIDRPVDGTTQQLTYTRKSLLSIKQSRFPLSVPMSSSSFYPCPTKWGWYKMFSSCCDKDSAFIFTTGRLPDVNPPCNWSRC